VPLPGAATDDTQFKLLKEWLASYKPEELFNRDLSSDASAAHESHTAAKELIDERALRIIPKNQQKRMGMVDEAYRGFKKLEAPKWQDFGVERGEEISNMKS
jgi:xylulose-5-phosphate/fructose-6-phosphate phosphoketolase